MFKFKIISKVLVICICFTFFVNSIYCESYIYTGENVESNKKLTAQSSIATTIATPTFTFQSQAQYLVEPTTGKVIYANNENEKFLPASVTKVMSLLLIMEQIDSGKLSYNDKVTCSEKASKMGGSQIWFRQGEQLLITDALKAICVVSANDVTYAMSELIGGSEENFVKMMNDKALSLGMENTHFMNCHGIDEENHYTSAKDIGIMSMELINKHPDILKYTSIWMDSLRDGSFGLTNTNKLIRFYEGSNGLKTGSTSQALFNLAASATRNNSTYIAIVMKAPSSQIRADECTQLLDYAFSNYETKSIFDKDTIVETKKVNKNVNIEAEVVLQKSVSALINKGEKIEFLENITYNDEELIAPITNNQVVGKIEIINKSTNEVLGYSELIIKKDISKSNFKDYVLKLMKLFLIYQ